MDLIRHNYESEREPLYWYWQLVDNDEVSQTFESEIEARAARDKRELSFS